MFDRVADELDAELAPLLVRRGAYLTDADRTARTAHGRLRPRRPPLAAHGAALFFHHSWTIMEDRDKRPFHMINEHILLPIADSIAAFDESMTALITEDEIERIVDLVPDAWMKDHAPSATIAENRKAYVDYLTRRLDAPRHFVEEMIRVR